MVMVLILIVAIAAFCTGMEFYSCKVVKAGTKKDGILKISGGLFKVEYIPGSYSESRRKSYHNNKMVK